ncbi:HAD-IA family hydrolase, partial [Candidatus Dojkabacteria bacterium]|nr:HAD-IA family hydrolase [Candidatus Dojkabacteria bacterium]
MIKALITDFSRVLFFPLDEGYEGIFNDIFRAKEMGISKDDPSVFELLAETLNLQPEEIVYVDDKIENVRAAESIGMKGVCFVSNYEIFEEFK